MRLTKESPVQSLVRCLSVLCFACDGSLAAGVVGYDPKEALFSAYLSTAAYCGRRKHGGDATIARWNCGPPCDAVPVLATEAIHGLGGWGANGFVALLEDRCVLSFRGTGNTLDWVKDFASDFGVSLSGLGIHCSYGNQSCRVGAGFLGAYLTVVDKINAALDKFQCKSKPLMVTGHSLGGAVASLAVVHLSNKGYTLLPVYTFGQPRVGNIAFANVVSDILQGGFFRVTHAQDPVPHLPPMNKAMRPSHHQFPRHMPTEIFYRSDSSQDYVICSHPESDSCSNQFQNDGWPSLAKLRRNANDHLTYFFSDMGFRMNGEACSGKKTGRLLGGALISAVLLGVVMVAFAGTAFWACRRKRRSVGARDPDLEVSMVATLERRVSEPNLGLSHSQQAWELDIAGQWQAFIAPSEFRGRTGEELRYRVSSPDWLAISYHRDGDSVSPLSHSYALRRKIDCPVESPEHEASQSSQKTRKFGFGRSERVSTCLPPEGQRLSSCVSSESDGVDSGMLGGRISE